MEEKILGEFKIGVIFGKMFVYSDRVEIKRLISSKVIPMSKIAEVSYNKLQQLTIETSGGQKTMVPVFRREVEKAANLITSLIGK